MRASTEAEQLFLDVYPRLAGWSARLVGSEDAGRDIAAEAFVKLISRSRLPDDPVPYLYRTALNQVRDAWRHQKVVDRALTLITDATTTDGPDTDLKDAVDRLPAPQREAVVLHYWADLPVTQVAEVLHKPAGSVSRLLHEARAVLRIQLEPS